MAANGLAAIGGQVAEQVGPMPGSGQQLSATTQAILAATGGGGAFEPHAAFEHVRDGSPFHWHLDAHGAVAPTAPPSLSATSLPMFPYATTASNMYPTEESENAIAAAMAAANAAAAAFAMSRASVGTPVASATASKKAGKKGGEPTSIYRGVNWEVRKQQWKVRIKYNKTYKHVAYVGDEEVASRLYDWIMVYTHGIGVVAMDGNVNHPEEMRKALAMPRNFRPTAENIRNAAGSTVAVALEAAARKMISTPNGYAMVPSLAEHGCKAPGPREDVLPLVLSYVLRSVNTVESMSTSVASRVLSPAASASAGAGAGAAGRAHSGAGASSAARAAAVGGTHNDDADFADADSAATLVAMSSGTAFQDALTAPDMEAAGGDAIAVSGAGRSVRSTAPKPGSFLELSRGHAGKKRGRPASPPNAALKKASTRPTPLPPAKKRAASKGRGASSTRAHAVTSLTPTSAAMPVQPLPSSSPADMGTPASAMPFMMPSNFGPSSMMGGISNYFPSSAAGMHMMPASSMMNIAAMFAARGMNVPSYPAFGAPAMNFPGAMGGPFTQFAAVEGDVEKVVDVRPTVAVPVAADGARRTQPSSRNADGGRDGSGDVDADDEMEEEEEVEEEEEAEEEEEEEEEVAAAEEEEEEEAARDELAHVAAASLSAKVPTALLPAGRPNFEYMHGSVILPGPHTAPSAHLPIDDTEDQHGISLYHGAERLKHGDMMEPSLAFHAAHALKEAPKSLSSINSSQIVSLDNQVFITDSAQHRCSSGHHSPNPSLEFADTRLMMLDDSSLSMTPQELNEYDDYIYEFVAPKAASL